MRSLQERLAPVLRDSVALEEEPDGALTLRHDGTFASLRVVTIVEDLELVSLNQVLAWDLLLSGEIRDRVASQAGSTLLGAVILGEKAGPDGGVGDVMLRYNFPAAGLTDTALRTLILMVLDQGAQIRRVLTA